MEPERPLAMNLWLGVYYAEFCPDCGARACVTQHVDYDESRFPRCIEAPEDQWLCHTIGCCHGCECDRKLCPSRCDCDCHHCEVVLPPVARPQPAVCACYACVNKLPCPVQTLSCGQRVTRRPRDCLRFASLGPDVFSTHYNNEDGRNHRLDTYFKPLAPKQRTELIVIDDDGMQINQ